MVSRYKFMKMKRKSLRQRRKKSRYLKSLIQKCVQDLSKKECKCDLKTVLLIHGCQCGGI